MLVIGEDNQGLKPTLKYCMNYALTYNIPPEKTFVDWGPVQGWETLLTHINPYGTGSGNDFALPWVAVLEGESMEYVFSSTGDLTFMSILTALNDALKN